MILTEFFRPGRPRTKGSLKAWCTKGRGHKIHLEEETKDSQLWRRQMAKWAQDNHLERHGRLLNWGGPVIGTCVFLFAPEAEYRDGQPTGLVIESHRTPFPTDIHLGDLDKLQRNLGDALEDAHVIENDRLIVAWSAKKLWTPLGAVPGVQVTIEALEVPAVTP